MSLVEISIMDRVLATMTPRQQLVLFQNPGLAVLAGGAIRDVYAGGTPHDVDFFFPDKESAKLALKEFIRPFDSVIESQTAFSVESETDGELKTQFIYFNDFTSPGDLLSQFDFTCCQAAIWVNKNLQLDTAWFLNFSEAVEEKKLVYLGGAKTLGARSLNRAFKLLGRGYTFKTCKTAAELIIETIKRVSPESVLDEDADADLAGVMAESYDNSEIVSWGIDDNNMPEDPADWFAELVPATSAPESIVDDLNAIDKLLAEE